MIMRKSILGAVTIAALSLTGLVAASTTASAYVACNREGDCWHTEGRHFDRGLGIVIHPDDWYFHRHWDGDRDHRWREYHDGRGFWRGGVWVTF